ncbi:hypothetical protein KJ616_02235 [Patescibacteria group bacterium]|nr:hypothetical protein [Patescibacteria group bacterium]
MKIKNGVKNGHQKWGQKCQKWGQLYFFFYFFLLHEKDKLLGILSPAPKEKCSILLKRTGAKISYINDQRSILKIRNEKDPIKDEP